MSNKLLQPKGKNGAEAFIGGAEQQPKRRIDKIMNNEPIVRRDLSMKGIYLSGDVQDGLAKLARMRQKSMSEIVDSILREELESANLIKKLRYNPETGDYEEVEGA